MKNRLCGADVSRNLSDSCVDDYSSIVDLFQNATETYGALPALECFGAQMSFGELEQKSRTVAAYLQNELGVKKGDRVALMAPNVFAFPIVTFGILRAGGCQVNVNPLYTPNELKHQLQDSGAETILIYSGSSSALVEIQDDTSIKNVITIDLADGTDLPIPKQVADTRLVGSIALAEILSGNFAKDFSRVELSGDDLIFLQYTGGTTGPSKGATLHHRNLVANIRQFKASLPNATAATEEVVVLALPLYHIFGLMLMLAYTSLGCRMILIPDPRDIGSLHSAIKSAGITVFPAVNTLFSGIALHPDSRQVDFSRLKVSIGGGAAIVESVSDKWHALTGQHITEGYGLSEASPLVTVTPTGRTYFSGTCGVPVPATDVKLLNDFGELVAHGESGEICIAGPQVMSGYWRRPDANKESFTDDGFFRTGDIGVFEDNGDLRIVDRKKDMILVSGFNVFPNEIEAVVSEVDGVAECSCVGRSDEKTGEAVRLFVVKVPNADVTEVQIVAHCRKELTAYKIPRDIIFVDELPKSAVGKILRRKLRDG